MSRLSSLKSFGLAILAAAVTLSFTPLANAQRPVSTITVGGTANFGVATNPVTNFTYVANYTTDTGTTIEQIDNQTGAAVAIATGATGPENIVVNPVTNKVYATNVNAGGGTSLVVCNGATDINGTVTNATCSLGITGLTAYPYLLAVNTVTNVIYTVSSTGTLTAINGNTNAIINTVTGVGTSGALRTIAVNPVLNYVYVGGGTTTSTVVVINGATTTGTNASLKTTLTLASRYDPSYLTVDPITDEVYVGSCEDNCSSRTPTTSVDYFLGNGTQATASSITLATAENWVLGVNPVTNIVYAYSWDNQAIGYFTGATGAGANASGAGSATATNYAWEHAFNSITNQGIYDSGSNGNDAYTFASTGAAGSTIATGTDPLGISLNPITNHAYVNNEGSGTVTVLDNNSFTAQTGVSTGSSSSPDMVAVNPASGAVYTANTAAGTVSAFTSATPPVAMSGSPITVGTTPISLAVDPVTSTVYVANSGSNNMTVIDENSGDPNVTATITTGTTPYAVAVNPVTNMVYVANKGSNNVTVYNESTNATSTITLGTATGPYAIAIDSGNNNIYVADTSGAVSQINGSTNTLTATLTTGSQTGAIDVGAIAVNPITHNVYVANSGTTTVTPITGCPSACAAGTAITVGTNPQAVAINPATNTIYVANTGSNNVSVISGATNTVKSTVTVGSGPRWVAVNTWLNEVYVPNDGGTTVTVIDGAAVQGNGTPGTTVASVTAGTAPLMVAWNPGNNQAYVVNNTSGTLQEITSPTVSAALTTQMATSIAGSTSDTKYVPNDVIYATTNTSPTFTATVATAYTNQTQTVPATAVYYTLDNPQGNWTAVTTAATGAGTASTTWTVNPTGVSTGVHTLYVFAAYGDENGATTEGFYEGDGNSPNIGNVTAYTFAVLADNTGVPTGISTTTTLASSANPTPLSTNVTYTATVTPASGTIPTTDSVTFYDGVTVITGCAAVTPLTAGTGNVTATCTTSYASLGTHYITAVFSGDSTYTWSQSTILTETTTNLLIPTAAMTSPVSTSPQTEPYGGLTAFTVTGTLTWTGAGTPPTVADISFISTAAGSFGTVSCTGPVSDVDTCSATFTPTATDAIGSYNINLKFSGDSNYAAVTSSQVGNFVISKGTLTATMTSSTYSGSPAVNTEAYGATTPFTVYATLSPAGSVAPTAADVSFATSTAGIGAFGTVTCAVVSGVDQCSAVFTPNGTAAVGSYNINVSFSGDTNYSAAGPSSNGTGIYVVTIASPTLTLSPSPIASTVGSVTPITITATATITTGTVNFTGTYATYGTLSATSCTLSASSCTVSFTPNGTTAAGTYSNILTGTLAATANNNSATANDSLLIAAANEYTALAVTTTPIAYFSGTTSGTITAVLSWINPAVTPSGTITFTDTTTSRTFGVITLSPTGAAIASTACTTAGSTGTCTYTCAAMVDLSVSCTLTNTAASGTNSTSSVADSYDGNTVTAAYSGNTFFSTATGTTYLYNDGEYPNESSPGTIALSGTAIANSTYGLTTAESPTVKITDFSTDPPTDSTGIFLDITSTGQTGTMYENALTTCTATPCTIVTSWTFPAVVAPGTYSLSYNYSGNYQSAAGDTDQTTLTSGSVVVSKQTPTMVGTMTFSPAATEPFGTSQAITISDTLTYLGIGEAPQGAVTYTLNGTGYVATCGAAVVTGSGNTQSNVETCTATVPATTIAALPVAVYTVTAGYTADTNYGVATGTSGTFTITAIVPTIALTPSPVSSPFGSVTPIALTATVTGTAGGGSTAGTTVNFSGTYATYGTLSATSCVTTVTTSPASSCSVNFTPNGTTAVNTYSSVFSATAAAEGNYAASAATTDNLTITAIAPTDSLSNVTTGYETGATITASSNATGSLVTFGTTGGVTGTFSPTTCTIASGSCSVTFTPGAADTVAGSPYTSDLTASFGATTNYTSGSATSTLTITAATPTLTMVAGTPGTTSLGVTTTTLVATLTPNVAGSTVTFTDVTTGATIGTATTIANGTATITVNTAGNGAGQISTPSGGKNLFSAAAGATANTNAANTTSNTTTYFQGILFSVIGTHNFSGLLTGAADPYSCCTTVEGTVDGTTATAFGVGVYNFTSSSQSLPVSLTNAASGAFSLSNQCGATLTAGEACTLVFNYAPPNGDGCTPALPATMGSCTLDGSGYPQGTYETGTWSYTLPGGVLGGLGNSGFTTSGIAAASGTVAGKALLTPLSLSVSPTTAAFGSVAQGATSNSITITVTNNNSSSVSYTYTPPSSGHFNATNNCATPLAAKSSCNIQVSMVTTTTGTFTDSLILTPSGGTASTVSISGTVAAASTGITLSSNNHSFGNVTDGTTVAFSTTLTNNTGSTATISFSNSAGAGYSTSTTCGTTLAASATCTYYFTFAPTTPGASTDTLTITSSVPILPGGMGSGPYTGTVTASGTGVAGGHLTATSVTHNWGAIAVGTSGGNYGLEITNSSSSAVTLSYSGLTGGSSGFALVGSSCGASLAVNANCELIFSFTPTATGFVSGTYPITSSSPLYFNGSQVSPEQITLEGTGQ